MILFLPKWYPSRLDPQLGVFVQKHARAVSLYEKVVVLSVQGDTGLKKSYLYTESREGNLYEVIIYFKKKPDTKKLCINAWHYLKAVRKGLYMIKTKHGIPALIHTHVLLRPVLLAWWLGKKYGIPFILTEHWTGFIYGAYVGKPGYYRWICSRLVSRAAAVTAVSPALLEALKKNRLHNPKMVVIPNVVEVSMPDFSGRKANDKIRILTVADLVERNKNIIAGIEAIGQLRKKYEKVEYHIIGGGEDEALIRQKAGELDPGGEWIFFYGRRENTFVLDFMRTIDFILTNSRIETFSVATAEALAMGKPVVATRSGGPEFFVNEHNGILINPGDQKELSAALEKMTLTFNTYDPKAISAEVLEKYGGKSVGLEFYNLYKEILPINHV